MFDRLKFKAIVVLRGCTMAEIAQVLGIDTATLYRKMNGESDFFRKEIDCLCRYLQIENPQEIFFAEKVTQTQKHTITEIVQMEKG